MASSRPTTESLKEDDGIADGCHDQTLKGLLYLSSPTFELRRAFRERRTEVGAGTTAKTSGRVRFLLQRDQKTLQHTAMAPKIFAWACKTGWILFTVQAAAGTIDTAWIKEAMRDEIVFDTTRNFGLDRATMRTTLLDDGWPRKRVRLGENAFDAELRLARFPTETQAIKMMERLRYSTPSAGAAHPNWPAVADEVYDFNGYWMVARRRTVVIELFPDQTTDTTVLLESVRLVVAQIDKIQAELDREQTNESTQRATVHVEPKKNADSEPKPLVPAVVEKKTVPRSTATVTADRNWSVMGWIVAAALFVGAVLWITKRRFSPPRS